MGICEHRHTIRQVIQSAAATTIEEKFSDAAQVHTVTGACPTLALHVQWDLPNGLQDAGKRKRARKETWGQARLDQSERVQDQEYKFGSVGNPDASIRRKALNHILDCVKIAEALGCRDISPWFADGSNYPGTQSIRKRIGFSRRTEGSACGASAWPEAAGRIQTL